MSKSMDLFNWIGKQLMKPSGVVAKEAKAIGDVIGNLIAISSPKISAKQGIKKAAVDFVAGQKGALDVLTGKTTTSFSKEMKEAKEKVGLKENTLDKIAGIGADFIVDPLTILKPVKLLKKGLEATKLLKPTLKLGAKIKGLEATKKVLSAFTNATDNPEFNAIVEKYRNLKSYKEANLITQSKLLAKTIKGFGKGAEEIITEGLENPQSLSNITDKNILNVVGTLKNTYKSMLDEAKNVGLSIGEIVDYAPHIRTKESFLNKLTKQFGLGAREFGIAGAEKGRKIQGTIKEITERGLDIFEKNPAIQLAKKGQVYAKAITSKQFANDVAKFAIEGGVKVTNPLLKGLKFVPEQAKVIDNFYKTIKPDELKFVIKSFDKIQNWWKAQALIAPSYHVRNTAGNLWNNFLAGVNPADYIKATMIQTGKLKTPLIEEMKKLGVINEGWYAADISDEVMKNIKGGVGKGLNLLSQQNYLFRGNKAIGSAVENNARIAHYLSMIGKGKTPEEAALSVKKYLFDYGDLTDIEKNILKRFIPFYTWSRKNLPLQLSELVAQPEKFVLPHKIIREIESGQEKPNEKYMSDYIKTNIPVQIRKNKKGNFEYFMLGQWLPYASAIDLLSNPIQNIINATSPLIKTAYEQKANKSLFFKTTTGEQQPIERYEQEQGKFLGQSMRKKNINLLRNIRILNEMDKWVKNNDPEKIQDSFPVKALNLLFGKTATYDGKKSKYFYDRDTGTRRGELERALKSAKKIGDAQKVELLKKTLKDFIKQRNAK